MEGKDVLRGVLVGDQANGTQWAKEEFILSTLCIRGVHGPIQICCALVLVASQVPVCSIGMSGISQKLGDGAGWGQPVSVLPPLSLAVLIAVLICMSGKALLEKKNNPPRVAVSALAVVRQCKIKLIKPPTQENITGN